MRFARDSETYFCDMEPPQELVQTFFPRRDNQIMGLEILSVSLGTAASFTGLLTFCLIAACLQVFPPSRRRSGGET